MSRIFQFRHAARMLAARAGPGVCIGTGYVLTATPIRLDAAAPATTARPPSRRTLISPQAVKQIARGSFAGKFRDTWVNLSGPISNNWARH